MEVSSIEEHVSIVIRRRLKLIDGHKISFYPDRNTIFELKFILSCLCLPLEGTPRSLVERIMENGVYLGHEFPDDETKYLFLPSDIATRIVSREEDASNAVGVNKFSPMCILRTLLRMMKCPTAGSRDELIEKIERRKFFNDKNEATIRLPQATDDRSVIRSAITSLTKGETLSPRLDDILVFEKYGYYYNTSFENFIHIKSGEKLCGNKGIFDSICIGMFSLSWNETHFTDESIYNVSNQKNKDKSV